TYLERAAGASARLENLKTKAKELGRDTVARKRYRKAYADLSAAEKQAVDGLLDAAVREEARLLTQTVNNVFARDLRPFEQAMKNRVTSGLTQEEYDALVSFIFNVGAGAFAHSWVLSEDKSGGIS